MFDGVKGFAGWLSGVGAAMSAKTAIIATSVAGVLTGLSAGLSALVGKALSYFSSIDVLISNLTGNLASVGEGLRSDSLWAALSYLLGLDVALKAFLSALPALLLGIVGVLLAGVGVFLVGMLALSAYVAVKRLIASLTLGYGRV